MSKVRKILPILILILGALIFISPLFVYQWIHGDYERYLWIINQQYPLSHLGSFGYQATLYGALAVIGIGTVLIALGIQFSRRILSILGALVIGIALVGFSIVLTSQSGLEMSKSNLFQPSSQTQEQAQSDSLADFSLSDEFQDDWHVAENNGDSALLVKEQENERYEIRMSVISIEEDPGKWIESQVDFDDVTTLSYEWSFVNDLQHVRVDYDGPRGATRSDYLLGNESVVSMTQYPLEADYDTGRLYTMLMHTTAYELVDPVYSRGILRENCTQDVSNKNTDDITVNPHHRVATLHWTNYETNENQRLTVAYEPETGFAGCSASVTSLLADHEDAVRFACPYDYQFTMIYLGEDNDQALLQLPTETHRVSVARSGSGARYTNEDESVIFWEHQGEALIEKGGEVVREHCVPN